jgi:hypothetical protein
MKIVPTLFAFLLPSLSVGAVTIRPGQSITVEPGNQRTVVSCAPAAAPEPARGTPTGSTGAVSSVGTSPVRSTSGPTSGAFCYCRSRALPGSVDYNLIKVTLGPEGERAETALRNYSESAACEKAIAAYPSCR